MSDHVIVMDSGRIMQSGTPKELYRRPVNRFVADFVGRASFIDVAPAGDGRGWTTPDGAVIQVDEAQVGSGRYQAMLRPESIVVRRGTAAADDAVNRLSGQVRNAQYLGAHTEYAVAAGGAVLKVQSSEDFEPGADVTVSFSPADCRLVAVLD
jgi:ABC-type Fe3+/spermidine/putrescine transport system ATPase subunit